MSEFVSKLGGRALLCGLLAATGILAVTSATGVASATPVHDDCTGVVTVGTTSAWCGLYPGNAVHNTPEEAQVSLDSTGTLLGVLTQNTSDGSTPATTSVCLTATPIDEIDHRLQDEQCTNKFGGVWLTWDGGSNTIDLSEYPQFLGTTFTVQVGASASAENGNGDAFYNNIAVNSEPSATTG